MSGELILVFDDEPNTFQLARLYLEREGFRDDSRANGKFAIEKVKPGAIQFWNRCRFHVEIMIR